MISIWILKCQKIRIKVWKRKNLKIRKESKMNMIKISIDRLNKSRNHWTQDANWKHSNVFMNGFRRERLTYIKIYKSVQTLMSSLIQYMKLKRFAKLSIKRQHGLNYHKHWNLRNNHQKFYRTTLVQQTTWSNRNLAHLLLSIKNVLSSIGMILMTVYWRNKTKSLLNLFSLAQNKWFKS